MEGVLQGQRRLFRGPWVPGWRFQDRQDGEGPPDRGGAPTPGGELTAPGSHGAPSADAWAARRVTGRLPVFPWDRLAEPKARAAAHPGGIVDLSVGTPVDPVPESVRRALAEAADSPGYPQTYGTPRLREAAADWLRRRHGVDADPDAVLPTIGSKELVAGLPAQLGIGPGDVVVHPELAYPTYDVGARLAGARPVATDGLTALGPESVPLIWLNSPSNPTGRVLPPDHLRKVVRWARERGAVVASDECYIGLGWDASPLSILHPEVCEGSHANLLAVHSLSKRSNLAGYRAAFVTGDPDVVGELLAVRKHAGVIMPEPVQAAMTAALADDTHAEEQRERYARRRAVLWEAMEAAGWKIDHSEAGLYLWAEHPAYDAWGSVNALADLGILVAPGDFYGPAGARSVRVAVTATDERVEAAVARLTTT
ncbi:MAG: succinyldiaminopimelate transaminase [Streptosporangiales bacterium]|nr:succinyldiaminopimelate transaminase [Streptosporangiales bacterium]